MTDWEKQNYISLGKAAEGTPYSQEYLSLLVRKGKINAKKFGRNWYVTQASIHSYLRRQQEAALKKVNLVRDSGKSDNDICLQNVTNSEISNSISDKNISDRTLDRRESWMQGGTKQRSDFTATFARFILHMGMDGILIGGVLAGSFAIGAVGMNMVQEMTARPLFASVPSLPESDFFDTARIMSRGLFSDVLDATVAGWRKSNSDFSGLAALAEENIGFRDRVIEFFAPLKIASSRRVQTIADFSPSLYDIAFRSSRTISGFFSPSPSPLAPPQKTQTAKNNVFVPPLIPTPLLTGSIPASSPTSSPTNRTTQITQVRQITETREVFVPADFALVKSDIIASVNQLNAGIRAYVTRQISGLSSSVSTASQSAASSIQMVSVSQDISNLIAPIIQKGFTLASGDFAITKGSINITEGNVTADTISARNNLGVDGDLSIGGGDLAFASVATTSILSDKVNAFSIATSTSVIPFMSFDTLNYRIGIGTTSPGNTFSVNGNILASGKLNVNGSLTTYGSGTTTFRGISVFSKIPTLPHTFGTWSSGVAASEALNAVLIVNPASAAADTNLISASVNDSPRFLVDAEGDVFVNSLTSVGATTLSETTASSFVVENSTRLGDAVGDVLTVYAGSVRQENLATTTILNNSVNAFAFAASTTQNTLFSLDTSVETGRVGIATSAPWGLFSIEQTQIDPVFVVSDKGTSTPHFWIDGTGNVGVGSTSPQARFAVNGSGTGTGRMFTLADSSNAERLTVLDNGNVGIGTTSPAQLLAVAGHCVTGDTRLRRRRRKKKNANGEWEYEYDEVEIKDIQQGDEIASLNEEIGKIVWSKVNALMDMGIKPIYKLTTASGKTIRTTGEHPYLVKNIGTRAAKHISPIAGAGWLTASAIGEGDIIATADGGAKKPPRAIALIDYANIKSWLTDKKLRIDLDVLRAALTASGISAVRFYYGSDEQGKNDSFFAALRRMGYQVITKPVQYFAVRLLDLLQRPRNQRWLDALSAALQKTLLAEAEKLDARGIGLLEPKANFDVEITGDALEMADSYDTILLFSGDGDFADLARRLRAKGKRVVVVSGKTSLSGVLKKAVDYAAHFEWLMKAIKGLVMPIEGEKDSNKKPYPALRRGWENGIPSIAHLLHLSSASVDNPVAAGMQWERVEKIDHLPSERVYDIEVEGTHNFIGNDIVAHNTYITGGLGIGRSTTTAGTLDVSLGGVFGGLLSAPTFNATSTTASSTFGGGAAIAQLGPGGLFSSNGITLTGGSILNTSSATSTFTQSGISVAGGGLASANGLTLTGGNILSTVSGTSTVLTGNLTAAGIVASAGLSLTGGGFRNTVSGTSTLLTGNLDAAGITASNGLTITGGNISTASSDLYVQPGQNKNTLLNSGGGNVGIGTTSPGKALDVIGGAGVSDYFYLRAANSATAASTQGIAFTPIYTGTTRTTVGQIDFLRTSATDGNYDGEMAFFTRVTGSALAERVRIDKSGNVGIGTTSPGALLAVQGNGGGGTYGSLLDIVSNATAGPAIFLGGNTSYDGRSWRIIGGGSGNLSGTIEDSFAIVDHELGSARLVINSSGNVGIGTTSPGALLAVQGNGGGGTYGSLLDIVSNATAGPAIFLGGNTSYDGRSWRIIGGGSGNLSGTIQNSFAIVDHEAGAARLVINSSGNVGIGTTGPGFDLDIRKTEVGAATNLRIRNDDNTNAASDAYLSISAGGTSGGDPYLYFDHGLSSAFSFGVDQSDNDKLKISYGTAFKPGTGDLVTIQTDGNVGIGTTGTSAKLHVVQTAADVAQYLENSNADATPASTVFYKNTASPAVSDNIGQLLFYGKDSGANVQSYGQITVSSTDVTDTTEDGRMIFATTKAGTVTDTLALDSGNVGIGTTSPGAILDTLGSGAGGDVRFTRSDQGPSVTLLSVAAGAVDREIGQFVFQSKNSAGTIVELGRIGMLQQGASFDGGNIYFKTVNAGGASTERVRITTAGNVGIGTTSPQATLGIAGSLGVSTTHFTLGAGGTVGIGAAVDTTQALRILNTNLTGTSQYGVNSGITGTSAGTTLVAGIYSSANTAAASYTAATVTQFLADVGGKGAGSTITNLEGFTVNDLANGTNNYGFRGKVSSGTNKYNLYMDGTAQNYIAGNVGIGTTSPGSLLSVSGSSGFGLVNTGTGNTFYAYDEASDASPFVIDNAGNVGIGTTGPDGKLHVMTASGGTITPNVGADDLVVENDTNGGISILTPDASQAGLIFGTPSDAVGALLYWEYSNSLLNIATSKAGAHIQFKTGSEADAMRIQSDGNVGIGTTSPGQALAVVGIIKSAGVSNSLMFSDRTTGANTWEWYSDSNTARLYKNFNTAGDVLAINSSGNVGIGTTAPGVKLHVTATPATDEEAAPTGTLLKLEDLNTDIGIQFSNPSGATASDFINFGDNDADVGQILYSHLSNFMAFRTNAGEKVRIDSSGNVGIGTTSPSTILSIFNATPTIRLSPAAGYTTDYGYLGATYTAGPSEVADNFDFKIAGGGTFTTGGNIRFFTQTGGAAPSERVRIDKSGNVGIGTTSPDAKLVITSDSSSVGFLKFDDSRSGAARMWTFGPANGSPVNTFGIRDNTVNATRVTIDSTGNVGIGTTSPGTLLSVQGAVSMFLQGTVTTNGVCHTGDAIDTADSTVGRQLVVCSGAGVDIAEWYPTKSDVAIGDIIAPSQETMTYQAKGNDPIQGTEVVLGNQRISLLKKAERNDTILGIVSTAPYKTFGTDIRAYASSTQPIALAGRVPVNVNLEGGEIKIGDRITLSSVAGVGTKATTSGMTIGIALEPFDGAQGEGKVLVFVNLGYAKLDSAISAENASTPGNIATNAWVVDQQSGKVNVSFMGDINMQGNSILDVKKITGYLGKWSIDEEGTLMAVRVITDEMISQKLTVEESAAFGSAAKPIGITLYDEVTKEPYCVKIVSGVVTPQAGACGATTQEGGLSAEISSSDTTTEVLPPAGGETSVAVPELILESTATTTPLVIEPAPDAIATSTPAAEPETATTTQETL